MKKSFLIKIIMMIAAVLPALVSVSKAQTAQIAIDSNNVEFGCPVRMRISAKAKIGDRVTPPAFRKNEVIPGIEILQVGDVDTVSNGVQDVTYTFNYDITSFEDSTFVIPQQAVVIEKDTFYTNEKAITFTLLQNVDSTFYNGIDTTQQLKIFDVKDVKQTPWTFEEFWHRYGKGILFLLVFGIIIALLTYVVVRKVRNQPLIPFSKPKEPAHKQALLMLNNLKDMKLCEEGKFKEYYTYITEILKNYISDRWGTSVMESSTTETLAVLKKKIGAKSVAYNDMQEISSTADFVKFAKMEPAPDENARTLSKAFEIVESTKQTEQEILEEETVVPTPGFLESVKETLTKRYFDFRGRARRSELWWFQLANFTLTTIIAIINLMVPVAWAGILFVLMLILAMYTIVPTIGLAVRRLHDIGYNWKYIFLYMIPIAGAILYILWNIRDSQRGPNHWGAAPKYPNSRNTEFLNSGN